MGWDPRLLDILVCPADQGALHVDPVAAQLVCQVCHRRYDISDGIAVMLPTPAPATDPDVEQR